MKPAKNTIVNVTYRKPTKISRRNTTTQKISFVRLKVIKYHTGNLGQDGGRVCYFIQNSVVFLLDIEWEVF